MVRDKLRLPENTPHPSVQKEASNKAVKIHPGSPESLEEGRKDGVRLSDNKTGRETEGVDRALKRVRHAGLSWSY